MSKHKKAKRSWTDMLTEQNVRERIDSERGNGHATALLDYLATRIQSYEGQGWSVFNDWLDRCYFSDHHIRKLPAEIPLVSVDEMRQIVFPACREKEA